MASGQEVGMLRELRMVRLLLMFAYRMGDCFMLVWRAALFRQSTLYSMSGASLICCLPSWLCLDLRHSHLVSCRRLIIACIYALTPACTPGAQEQQQLW